MAKYKRVNLSDLQPDIITLGMQYQESTAAINLYFSQNNPNFSELFLGWSRDELQIREQRVHQENELALSLVLLSALEAKLRIDYIERTKRKLKDDLSRAFRALAYEKGNRVSLQDDILDSWKNHTSVDNQLIGQIKSAFNYRHWLAHGRYWTPKFGQSYDFYTLYLLIEALQNDFEFIE